jgi:hypothetical protein
MGKINYLIIDETDPAHEFECEGDVIETFFSTSKAFNFKKCKKHIHSKTDLEDWLRREKMQSFNIVHLAAHGRYRPKSGTELDYSAVYRQRGSIEKEIFRPDTIVRACLEADLLVSTCCETFNDHFLGVLNGYGGVANFIAPQGDPYIGDTIVFSLMLYNGLIREVGYLKNKLSDKSIRESFKIAQKGYKAYQGEGDFKLYSWNKSKIHS